MVTASLFRRNRAAGRATPAPIHEHREKAVELWLRKETEALMAKGYEEMAEEGRELAEITFESQREAAS